MSQQPLPEFNRLIKLQCEDWSRYTCVGKLIPYKIKKGNRPWRFMIRNKDGTFDSDHDCWRDMESWEYVED